MAIPKLARLCPPLAGIGEISHWRDIRFTNPAKENRVSRITHHYKNDFVVTLVSTATTGGRMQITRKDIGYTVYSRLEEALRLWARQVLLSAYGAAWLAQIPAGIQEKVQVKLAPATIGEIEDPLALLEETDLPDLSEIFQYRKGYRTFVPDGNVPQERFKELMGSLYDLRTRIAHVKQTFTALDLDRLIGIAKTLIPVVKPFTKDLEDTLACLGTQPERVILHIPPNFFLHDEPPHFAYPTNLPPADYDPDGGFIGRKDDLARIENLILGEVHRVITVTGAGGVGKTALAHYACQRILSRDTSPFSAVVWVSAKEEALTVTGIESIDPTLRDYEDLLDSILETFGWFDELSRPLDEKQSSVEVILRANNKGLLLVVDNLEALGDTRVIEYIKDFPPPNKVLVTSRLGMGEVERRYPLREMSSRDAVQLLRTLAMEKGATGLAKLPEATLAGYVDRMARYPLAIKWVVGQVALGKDVEGALSNLASPTGDVARFSFERIFSYGLSDNARLVLFALASYDKPLTRGILSHLTNLVPEDLDSTLRELTIASLVIPSHVEVSDARIETQYDLLSLTRNFIRSKLMATTDVRATLQARIQALRTLLEESERASRQYSASLPYMGAQTEEEKIAATWVIAGIRKFQAQDYPGAIQAFERATQIAPHFAAAYREWASVESQAGFSDKADELIRKAAALGPKDPTIWTTWGVIDMRRQQYDEAVRQLLKALELNPNDYYTIQVAAEVEKRRGNFEEATKLLKLILERDDSRPPAPARTRLIASTSLADNLRRWSEQLRGERKYDLGLDRLREALEYARQGLELDHSDAHAGDTYKEVSHDLGVALLRAGHKAEAIRYFQEAISATPVTRRARMVTARACYFVTSVLAVDGSIDEARKYYELGRKFVLDGTTLLSRYDELSLEFTGARVMGKVVEVIADRGFGFVEPDNQTGRRVFVHISSFLPEPTNEEFAKLLGMRVSFLISSGPKGPNAKRASVLQEDLSER